MEIDFLDPTKDYRETIKHWQVDEDGDLVFDGWYRISRDRLAEPDWISHIRSKTWCNLNDFIPAYLKACEMAGIKSLTISLYGWDSGYKFEGEG